MLSDKGFGVSLSLFTNCFLQQNKTENKSVAKDVGNVRQDEQRSRFMWKQIWWDCPFTGNPLLQGMHPMIPVTTATMQETFLFLPFESDSLMGSRISAGELLVLLKTFFMLFVMPSTQGSKKTYKTVKNNALRKK